MDIMRMHVRVVTVAEITTEHPPQNDMPQRTVVRLHDETGKLLAFSDPVSDGKLRQETLDLSRALSAAQREAEGLRADIRVVEAGAATKADAAKKWETRANQYYNWAIALRNAMHPDNVLDQNPGSCLVCHSLLDPKQNWLHAHQHTPECIIPKVQW